jgi:hypothetical protein
MAQYCGASRGHIEHLRQEELSGSLLPFSVCYFNFLLLIVQKIENEITNVLVALFWDILHKSLL